ncbi:hypothetical protein MARVELLAND_155 [Bacillus phage vB_BspM_MarvelLand]|nr:hypothetical protein MARVELLAND_155 [Bacillus phage vB_BspM_MarvelLand]
MAETVDITQYDKVPFKLYNTLAEKLQALLNGEVLFIKGFERKDKLNVLIRLVDKKYTVSQISYDVTESKSDERYWLTFNVGLNDLSLFTVFKFEEDVFLKGNKYQVNDKVTYISRDGTKDAAIITEVYQAKADPNKFAYGLSREPGTFYKEEELSSLNYE